MGHISDHQRRQGTMTLQASYVARVGSPLAADPALYGPIGRETSRRTLIRSEVIPVRSGRAWTAPAGRVVRFSIVEGPQGLDLNLWNRHDPRERFWAARTRQFYGAHVTTGDRLWSTLPFLRPLATIVADSLAYGRDADGAGCHDLLGRRPVGAAVGTRHRRAAGLPPHSGRGVPPRPRAAGGLGAAAAGGVRR